MKLRAILCFVFLAFCVLGLTGTEKGPVAVSPGSDFGIAVVGERCPTFSWTAVEWATSYRISVFEAATAEVMSYEQIAAMAYPVLSKEIPGRALSWTPSSDERLSNGSVYVWYVQAMDAYGTMIWSEGKVFRVDVALRLVGMEETLRERLREAGVSEEVITEVLDDMRAEVAEVRLSDAGTQGSGYNTTDRIGISEWDSLGNTWYGEFAGASLTLNAEFNSFFGYSAGNATDSGDDNTFIGYAAGENNTGGKINTFIGSGAGYANTTGNRNTFLGTAAGLQNTEGDENVFIGTWAGHDNTTGNFNTILGFKAGFASSEGTGNVFLGCKAGYNETDSYKLYIDNSDTSSPLIYGEFDNDIVAINGKLGVGTQSPEALLEIVNPSGRSDLVLNRNDGAAFTFEAKLNNVRFGSLTAHRLKLIVGGDPKVTINTDGSLEMKSGATCTAAGVWTDASSRAYKENIQDLTLVEAKDALSELNPVKYNYKKDNEEEYLGFIAEDVPELVASKDRKGISPMDVVAVLTKVVQEQQEAIMEHRKTLSELKERIAELEDKTETQK
jgi:hypothetical protein